LVVAVLGWLIYLAFNIRAGRREVASEIELAPNRSPYLSDEELEGPKIFRVQLMGVGLLFVVAIGLPLYWILEPGRQAGAKEAWNARFADWGSQLFDTTANGGFNCAGCHGGMKATGGAAPFVINDPATGEAKSVQWKAPALDTILLRYRPEEVTTIITYGRPFSPMSAWGVAGGGPMNDQQIETLIEYLKSIQLCDVNATGLCEAANKAQTEEAQKAFDTAMDDFKSGKRTTAPTMGEVLFSLDYASGAYSCARCHTRGWSYDDPLQSGSGSYGPSLIGGVAASHFPNEQDQLDFVTQPPGPGKKYGAQNQQFKPMAAFGRILTPEQIQAIVEYERGL
jgi:mono/diheme cytochrome c family protein